MSTKGSGELKRFHEGKPLTRKQAILAQCYECNGYEAEDCLGVSCPLYLYHPWRKVQFFSGLDQQKPSPETIKKMRQGLERYKKAKRSSK